MTNLSTIVKKELRSYFLSPIALIFLGVFLVATLFIFFTFSRFFARNIADIRPLFEWIPILMIFLVGAITMRSWSEEHRSGTLEILFTLPIKARTLALGKLIAGMVLVGMALLLTLPLPITVSTVGDLDWGPVIGGYVGALLLGAAYMAIGLCVSSRTDNQIVSLMVTSIICSLFYLVGSSSVINFFGNETGAVLSAIGSGSRFESISRGVLDLRDFIYYISVAAFFITLNVNFLQSKRTDNLAAAGKKRTATRWATTVLVGVNVLCLNFWLAPINKVRADLTEDSKYSLSDATEKLLANVDETLTISGYFSEKTHPLLAPLVPQIKDLLGEYEIRGQKVKLEFADPNKDEDLELELGEQYNVRSLPFKVSERHEESVVNSYFHILIRYGDKHEVLSFNDLVEIRGDDKGIDVRLRNMEYDMARAIKRVTQGFQSLEAMFAKISDPAKLTLFVTPKSLPERFKEAPDTVRKISKEIEALSNGKLKFVETNPEGNEALQKEIFEKYGFRPMAVGLFSDTSFYMYLLLEVGDTHKEAIHLQGADVSEATIRTAIESGIKRGTPGFLKTIALFTENPKPPPQNPNIPPQFQPPPPQPEYKLLQMQLRDDYEIKRTTLDDGIVPADVDILIVAQTGDINDKQRFAIDQYLMRGGAVITLVGAKDVKLDQGGLNTRQTDGKLREMLKTYGVTIDEEFVLDRQNARFPVPITETRGMLKLNRIKMMNYPFFPDIRQDSFNSGHVALKGLQNVILNWASPLTVSDKNKDVQATVLLNTSKEAWKYGEDKILPENMEEADTAFESKDAFKSYAVAATLTGSFNSYFADKASPIFDEGKKDEGKKDDKANDDKEKDEKKKNDRTGQTLKKANKNARLAVVSSSAFASDLVGKLSDQAGGGLYKGNFQFMKNLVDWSLADTDLLSIRSSGVFARTLKPMEEAERNTLELINYAFVLIALAIVVFIAITRRRNAKSILTLKGGKA